MAKSRTQKKSKIKYFGTPEQKQQLAEVTQAVDLAANYVKQWKLKQINNLVESANPPTACIPIGKNMLLIGKLVVKPATGGDWELVEYNRYSSKFFSSQLSAVAYAVCNQSGRVPLADEILARDTRYNELQNKLVTLKHNLSGARKKKDYWRIDLFSILVELSLIHI